MKVDYVDLPAQHRPLRESILAAIGRVLDHGQFILGPEVDELERRLAEFIGADDVVTLNSGTDALLYALRLRGIGSGHDVLTVSHSFVATASSIALVGATPVFVDLDPETMLMDVQQLETKLTERTRAVMPVHLNGYPCDIDQIRSFCDSNKLSLIEDCAQSIGARFRGRHVGTSDLGCFSLHPLKALSACGDGGFITTRDPSEAAQLRQLRNIGLQDRDHCASISGNSRLDTIQAAILLEKLPHLNDWLAIRRDHVAVYRQRLEGKVKLPPSDTDTVSTWSAFVVRHPKRDRLVNFLREHGIDVKIHYPLAIHHQEPFRRFVRGPLPVTDQTVREMFSLPISAEMSAEQRDLVIRTLEHALDSVLDE